MRWLILFAAISALAFWAESATAHERSVSYSFWKLNDTGAWVRVRVRERDLVALGSVDAKRYVTRAVELRAGESACEPLMDGWRRAPSLPGWHEWAYELRCNGAPTEIRSRLMQERGAGHLHFARVQSTRAATEAVLTTSDPTWRLDAAAEEQPSPVRWTDYLMLGIEHILTGYDHLAFLLVLILPATRFRRVISIATGFTVGHSATLALAATGRMTPVTSTVEALVGLSIVLVAAENVWLGDRRRGVLIPFAAVATILGVAGIAATRAPMLARPLLGVALFCACYWVLLGRAERPDRLRWAVASLFGLVHGFGFAGVISRVELPPDRAVPALFAFNVGVELGQIACIALAWPMVGWLRDQRGTPRAARVVAVGSAAAAGLGVFWFVQRGFG